MDFSFVNVVFRAVGIEDAKGTKATANGNEVPPEGLLHFGAPKL